MGAEIETTKKMSENGLSRESSPGLLGKPLNGNLSTKTGNLSTKLAILVDNICIKLIFRYPNTGKNS